jgi:Nif-specific regulatory protein
MNLHLPSESNPSFLSPLPLLSHVCPRTESDREHDRLVAELKPAWRPAHVLGNSRPMLEVYRLIEKVTRSRATVLILGESGVGKEVVASAIHEHCDSAAGPFIKFNCAALPESVIESELFGHERGSFTGAVGQRKGRFEEANGGTIFLDEVGELSMAMQAKLLRVLQEKTFERLGSSTPIKVDIRILAATNRDLPSMVANGTFREDLYYRLNVFPITIPPLRERGHDVFALADHFLRKFTSGHRCGVLANSALNLLLGYHWPGNVRELENVIERASILSDDGVIQAHHLPDCLQSQVPSDVAVDGSLESRLNALEYELIVDALQMHKGNMTAAAKHLGLTRRILGLRMSKHRLDHKRYR